MVMAKASSHPISTKARFAVHRRMTTRICPPQVEQQVAADSWRITMYSNLSRHDATPPKGGAMRTFTLGICACFLSLSLGWSSLARADAVTDWNANAGKAAIAGCGDAFHESRMYAMMHIAIHDALNFINRRGHPRDLHS